MDGASDEGPTHEEVQFYWTERHILKNNVATLVTTSSGSSFLNGVELQNGCLSLGHSNIFIPPTLAGSCMNPHMGAIDKEKFKENMSLAVDAYISRVNGCPCGDTEIQLFRGPDSSEQQVAREKLLIFLKGSNKNKEVLHRQDPTLYAHFKLVWTVRKNHMVPGLPSYVFYLICCHNSDCPHPRCLGGLHKEHLLGFQKVHLLLIFLYCFWILNVRGGVLPVLPVKASVPGITPYNLLMSLTIEPSPKLQNHHQSL